jgi:hypothetical protein
MSNVIELRSGQQLRSDSPPCKADGRIPDLDVTSPVFTWPTTIVEDVHRAVLLLDLALQSARLMTEQVADDRSRQILAGQFNALERQLGVAREMTRRL